MLTLSTTPEVLRDAVCQAVREGAWTTADVVATVATDYGADRASIVAVLWDLVEEGFLHWDASGQITCFAPVRTAAAGRRP